MRFPESIQDDMGFDLHKVQCGDLPGSFDTIKLPAGTVYEVREKDQTGIYRVIYVAHMGSYVHVLHAFKKKSKATPKHDKDIANERLRLLKSRQGGEHHDRFK